MESYLTYKKYHKNPVNITIHILCIPVIVWTSTILIMNLSNVSFILTNLYIFYYTYLNKTYFYPMAIALYSNWVLAHYFFINFPHKNKIAIILNILGWIAQVIGHSFFEKNKPAFMDSLVQSFLMAPLFVYLELRTLS